MLIRCGISVDSRRWTDIQRAEAKKQGFGYRAALFARLVCASSVPYIPVFLLLAAEDQKFFNQLP